MEPCGIEKLVVCGQEFGAVHVVEVTDGTQPADYRGSDPLLKIPVQVGYPVLGMREDE